MRLSRFALPIFAVLLPLIYACAPAASQKPRFFWPNNPFHAKIEYINFYLFDRDLIRGKENHFAEAILGIEIPKVLFVRPVGVASDGKGRVFVADAKLHTVVVLDLNLGIKRVLLDTDLSEKKFDFPSDVATDGFGWVGIADSLAGKIYLYGPGEILLKIISNDQLKRPTGLTLDPQRQRIYVADPGNHRIVVFGYDGQLLQVLGTRGKEPGQYNYPLDVDVNRAGNIYVLDSMNARVQVLDPEGNFLRAFGERGTSLGSFQLAKSLTVSPSDHVYVTDAPANRFIIFDLQGNLLLTVGGRYVVDEKNISPGGFNMPLGIDVDANDTIWVTDVLNNLIHRFQYLTPAFLAENPIDPATPILPFESPMTPVPSDGGNKP